MSEDFAQQMNLCCAGVSAGRGRVRRLRAHPDPSDLVEPPRVAESRVNMECRLLQIVHVSPKPLGGSLVIGEVVRFHIADEIVDDFKIDPDKLSAVGRMGGPSYAAHHGSLRHGAAICTEALARK